MIGPVQLLMIGFRGSEVPGEVRDQLRALRTDEAVSVIDLLALFMTPSRDLERLDASELLPDSSQEPGDLVSRLLTSARAASTMRGSASSGRGFLFLGNDIPQITDSIRPGTGTVAILLEHRWAIPLRDAVLASDAFPVGDAWPGRVSQQQVGLIPTDAVDGVAPPGL